MANVFGALNRFIARLDAEPQSHQQSGGRAGWGFQVLRNSDLNLDLEPWFDFIIGINGRSIDNADPNLFMTELRNCAGATISLGVFGAKGQQVREIYLSVPTESSLGLSLQWSPLSITDEVWHILDVIPNSPADVAGLLPYSDYVLGSPDGNLKGGEAGLGALVEHFMERPLRLWVYNNEYDVTRMVTITPSRSWGGEGSLGCVLGYGALHRIPAPLTEPSQAPGETLFEAHGQHFEPEDADQETQFNGEPGATDFLVPAEMSISSPPVASAASLAATAPPPGKAKKARAHHAVAPAAGLDDYFAEGEQKSRAADNAPSTNASGGLPPPPRAGGPPKAASPTPES
ncbi:hypothetical protein BAUCODRAFT_199336 [Baudoinia panamericana UAMH 10762]|uniref:PDZ GRASP-type domain-containing protein n=1 Tax=Baudoinia panamericana (strain UAMH 10762) TaxID=717646 RepID=M2MVY6_BAUPA|nr:uncharacterized protein BAUCODRAFT_199336 [Baudoinia panamericana UAMH 10762]EMD01147.1 hypothetical protein BAUCODRAFT_199336 [Baudoinia panamericana UAMH 10762]